MADYKVKSGDTLGSIAKRFSTKVATIQKLNNLKTTKLKIGQTLSIPGQTIIDSPYATQADQALASNSQASTNHYYTVKSGDSFWTIARNHRTSIKKILQWNQLTAKAKLKPGQKLLIANTSALASDGKITYQIKNGDTLHKIATQFSVSKSDLLNWNKVKNESYIHPGQELVIFLTAKN